MTLEDLMDVWRSQDVAPLHGVNDTLLRLALKQDEAKLQATRRRMKIANYFTLTLLVGMMALVLWNVISLPRDDASGWDYVLGVAGLAASLTLWWTIYVAYRTEARREERFGESLRDQLNRQLAMVDSVLSFSWRDVKTVGVMMLGLGVVVAINVLGARMNGAPYEEVWPAVSGALLYAFIGMAIVGWALRRWARRDLLPRQRRLEALLKELEA